MRKLALSLALATTLAVSGCASRAPSATAQSGQPVPYQEDTILREAEVFFGRGAQGIADVVNRVIGDKGIPDAYIKGEEGGAAVGVGLRYGHGDVYLKDGTTSKVYWRGPSVGLDFGGNAAKAFVLIYDLPNLEALYQRFGGVDGSLYYVGGAGVNYNRHDDIVLAPVRFGVGWRQGLNVGYIHLSPERSWIPF